MLGRINRMPKGWDLLPQNSPDYVVVFVALDCQIILASSIYRYITKHKPCSHLRVLCNGGVFRNWCKQSKTAYIWSVFWNSYLIWRSRYVIIHIPRKMVVWLPMKSKRSLPGSVLRMSSAKENWRPRPHSTPLHLTWNCRSVSDIQDTPSSLYAIKISSLHCTLPLIHVQKFLFQHVSGFRDGHTVIRSSFQSIGLALHA